MLNACFSWPRGATSRSLPHRGRYCWPITLEFSICGRLNRSDHKLSLTSSVWQAHHAIMTDDLIRRALAAYFRTGGTEQPAGGGDLVEHDGMTYVVLRNVSGILAVYRVRNDGILKRLKRWPAELER